MSGITADRWLRVKRLFEVAVEQPPSARSAFVSAAVADDETLRRDVEALIAADGAALPLSEQWAFASDALLAELRIASNAWRSSAPGPPGLTTGCRVGNYDVVAPLGAGGMGEVYRAHDARLGRDVAIKILPRAFTSDPERIAFRSNREGGGIFVMERTGEAVKRLTRRGFKPTWSPDGREIAFTTENADLDPQNTLGLSSLWIVVVSSGEERQLRDVDAVLPNWSPHGHRIAYTTRGELAGSTRLDVWTVDR